MDSKPIFEIETRTIEQTDRCNKCHSCLHDPDFQLCSIDFVAGDGEVLLMYGNSGCTECSYKRPFGSGSVCACPIRREIKLKYQR
ncbi:MAG: hypothetical protein AB2598_01965 [Candidatus Thiodiazotropha sp.]